MARAKQIETIVHNIEVLDYYGKLEVLEKLVSLLKMTNRGVQKKKHSLLSLEGLGKELWQGTSTDEYLDEERNSWN